MSDEETMLDAAWAALEEGDAERALELAAGVRDESPSVCVLRATARLELGDARGALEACDAAERAGDPDDPDVLWTRAEVHLALWRVDEAAAFLERLLAAPPDAGDHFANGLSWGQLVPGGHEELVIGDGTYVDPVAGGKAGRVAILLGIQ